MLQRPIVLAAALALLFSPAAPLSWAGPPFTEFIDPNPAAFNKFGATVVALSTGNVVITSPGDDAGGADAGAVYLFNGATGALISTLTGSTANDFVGSGGVTALTNGNYVVSSPFWGGTGPNAGAVTWGNGTTGIVGVVSASNSLVGLDGFDNVGGTGVTALTNGNYVVSSANWDSTEPNVGAVTWGNGTTGIVGFVGALNSLVGSTGNNFVGSAGVTALTNGNYVVSSQYWDGTAMDMGAVTWGNGTTGIVGVVSASNSLVGSTAFDQVGLDGVTALTNGNYVVSSRLWDGTAANVGAVTWGNGTTGIVGVVSASNSLVGSTAGDLVGLSVGFPGVTALTNGNYVVRSPNWDGTTSDVGAVTWGNGTTGIVGVVGASNSLVGPTASDQVGSQGVTALTNGNYVVSSPGWDGTALNVGAVTWGNGTTGIVGFIGALNSLVGSTANDNVGGQGVAALTNGNYVVSSANWDGTAADVGAVTWGNGTTGIVGVVGASNSLVGTTITDQIGNFGVTALTNGNYVVRSTLWDGTAANVGAVTWGNGTTGIVGVVSASNSLVGSTASDGLGSEGVMALTNGNYVVRSQNWDGTAVNVGAVTWGNGTTGIVGVVSASNSLVGSTANDNVGKQGVTALTNGNYVVSSQSWDGAAMDVGAVTWGNGTSGIVGVVSASNSLMGGVVSANLQPVVVDDINGTFFARFRDEAEGKVRLGSQADGIAPTLGAVSSSNVTAVSADVSGSVAVGSGLFVNARGFVYAQTAMNSAPTIGGTGVIQISLGTGTGPISTPLVGLASGVGYSFRAYATNGAGTTYSATGTFTTLPPATVPGAPTIGTATAGNTAASVAFTAPVSNGGSAITGYTATCGAQSNSGPTSPITVTGLTNGTAVTCTVVATNAVGNSAPSAASNSVTPATRPGPPTIGTATAGDTTASVAFTAPASDGGSPITGYTATCGTHSASGATSPITVTGLTNGVPVTCTVVATNAVANSKPSAASNSVTPATVPGAPTIGTATAGNTTVSVAFTAPVSNGGSSITGYTATCGAQSQSGPTSPITVTGLTNGTPVTCTVLATNAVGNGAASAASNSVTPATVPGAPTIGTATAGNTTVSVAFTAPVSNGGSPITGYTATCGAQSQSGPASPITVTGLTNGVPVTCTVLATNAVGNGAASAASNSVIPADLPTVASPTSSAISGTTATLGGNVTSDGGSAITERGVVYAETATNNDPLIGGTGVTKVPVIGTTGVFTTGVTGLSPLTSHSFKAFATNAVGTGYTSVATFTTTCPTITLASLPNGNLGAVYAGSATASGGTGPYTYAVTSGSLPGGLSLTASGAGAGDVSGTPSATGTFPFEITATDTSGTGTCTGAQTYSVVIDPELGQDFFTLSPCRVLDTRNAVGPLGGPALVALADRTFVVALTCGIPADAKAISLNIAVTGSTSAGNIRLHAGGTAVPLVSAINYKAGQTRSNNGVIPLSVSGELAAYLGQAAGTAHLILDVNGYFK